jgi:peroxiredoxin
MKKITFKNNPVTLLNETIKPGDFLDFMGTKIGFVDHQFSPQSD